MPSDTAPSVARIIQTRDHLVKRLHRSNLKTVMNFTVDMSTWEKFTHTDEDQSTDVEVLHEVSCVRHDHHAMIAIINRHQSMKAIEQQV